ncbi:amino acid ABC transporter substrate-binding protein [Noviherbaspirillum aridicola]|uniref:Amino acid ABC transporter substrate-binding protein n=1 Tax=Noviherbaspirillum aridicola TaxID=2849687 RepID=A0ABQ4Q837_9BURK|nr:amino acid ABC transporter substrate-binding protein [Noviherbaspirillum aridicola]GIZ52879.1 amino acid ABC transporter substrate-binding protein [Noviherbaspirillum aridicola]
MHTKPGRLAIACLAALCATALPAQAADTLDKIRASRAITIAHREASLPFSYFDDNRKPIGYAVELCQKIAEAVRRELKLPQLEIRYLPVTPSTRIEAIATGKADLECGSTTNNAERRKQVAFTIPHFVAAARMVVRTDSGIRNWSDLRGKRVVTTKGTTTVKLLNERDKVRALNLQLVEGADHNNSFAMVEKGEAAAFPMDDVLLFGLRAAAANPQDFSVIGDPLSAEPYAIMLPKDDPAFKAVVDREMSRLINDGEIYKLYDKWFTSPIPPRGQNMNMRMGHLLRDTFRFPTDKVGD